MKANELIIGQKYIWERNSSVTHEVIYLGCDDTGKFTMYEFEYLKEGEKMHTLLSVHHVESDVSILNHKLSKKELTSILKNRLESILFIVSRNSSNISSSDYTEIVKLINLSNMNITDYSNH